MASANAQHPPWSEDRVARELEAWFAQRAFEERPTYATFVRDGRKRLHAALMRTGGPQRWAQELGVLLREHPPGGGLRDDEVLPTLRSLLGKHRPQRFPTISWFERHGPRGLAAAIRRTGGIAHWAAVLNMPPPPGTHWTDELIESELRRVCADATRWPSRADFEAAGAASLLRGVYAGRGSRWWAQRLGLSTEGLRARRRSQTS